MIWKKTSDNEFPQVGKKVVIKYKEDMHVGYLVDYSQDKGTGKLYGTFYIIMPITTQKSESDNIEWLDEGK